MSIYNHCDAQVAIDKLTSQKLKQQITQQQPVVIPIGLHYIDKKPIYSVESPCLNIQFVFFNGQELFAASLQKKLSAMSDNIIGQCLSDEGLKNFLTKVIKYS